MAKANINLPNGTKIVVDGTTEEINAVLELYKKPTNVLGTSSENKEQRKKKYKTTPRAKKGRKGPKLYITELKAGGFFNKKRTISEVQKVLEDNGHIYPITRLSTPLKRLVQDKELGRMKEDGNWVYVKR